MEEALIAWLLAQAGVTAAVARRGWWAVRPQGSAGAMPCFVIYRIGGRRDQVMSGPNGLIESRVQIDCLGGTYLAAKGVARAVVAAMHNLADQPEALGVIFQGVFCDSERDDFEGESPERTFRKSLDFRLWHT